MADSTPQPESEAPAPLPSQVDDTHGTRVARSLQRAMDRNHWSALVVNVVPHGAGGPAYRAMARVEDGPGQPVQVSKRVIKAVLRDMRERDTDQAGYAVGDMGKGDTDAARVQYVTGMGYPDDYPRPGLFAMAADLVSDTIGLATGLARRAFSLVRRGADTVEDTAEHAADAVEDTAEHAADAVEDTAEAAGKEAVGAVRDVAKEVTSELDEMIDSLTDEARPARIRVSEKYAAVREGSEEQRPLKIRIHEVKASTFRRVSDVPIRSVRVQGHDAQVVRDAVKAANENRTQAIEARDAVLRAERQVRDARRLVKGLEGDTDSLAVEEHGVAQKIVARASGRAGAAREAFNQAVDTFESSRRFVYELRAQAKAEREGANKALVRDEPFALKGVLGEIARQCGTHKSGAVSTAEELSKRTLDRYPEYLPRDAGNAGIAAQRQALVEIARGGNSRFEIYKLASDALRGREAGGHSLAS